MANFDLSELEPIRGEVIFRDAMVDKDGTTKMAFGGTKLEKLEAFIQGLADAKIESRRIDPLFPDSNSLIISAHTGEIAVAVAKAIDNNGQFAISGRSIAARVEQKQSPSASFDPLSVY